MNPKYITVGIITSFLLCYVYDLTATNQKNRRFFTVDETGLTEENEE